ncbi:MAG: tetraacyldisaccharide 4'-kinase [Pelobium sp.]
MNLLRLLLFPISLIYLLVTWLRNLLYNWGIFKSKTFAVPIISVGNLEVGGSGKTPLVEYLIQLLKQEFKLATLSRGYGRKTKGFRWVKPDENYLQSGDEPQQLKQKFPDISVAVCEDRVLGIEEIEKDHQLILMDDAYQHRAVKPGLSILLFDYHQLQKQKFLLPAGNYREAFNGKKRANIFMVTKCPKEISDKEKLKRILKPLNEQLVFFTTIGYGEQLPHVFKKEYLAINEINKDTHVLLLTGIAKSLPLLQHLKSYTQHIIHHAYPDHHQFSQKNMLKLVHDFAQLKTENKFIITTQKDAVRLKADEFKNLLMDMPVYEWPIKVKFEENRKEEFDHLIKKYARQY